MDGQVDRWTGAGRWMKRREGEDIWAAAKEPFSKLWKEKVLRHSAFLLKVELSPAHCKVSPGSVFSATCSHIQVTTQLREVVSYHPERRNWVVILSVPNQPLLLGLPPQTEI